MFLTKTPPKTSATALLVSAWLLFLPGACLVSAQDLQSDTISPIAGPGTLSGRSVFRIAGTDVLTPEGQRVGRISLRNLILEALQSPAGCVFPDIVVWITPDCTPITWPVVTDKTGPPLSPGLACKSKYRSGALDVATMPWDTIGLRSCSKNPIRNIRSPISASFLVSVSALITNSGHCLLIAAGSNSKVVRSCWLSILPPPIGTKNPLPDDTFRANTPLSLLPTSNCPDCQYIWAAVAIMRSVTKNPVPTACTLSCDCSSVNLTTICTTELAISEGPLACCVKAVLRSPKRRTTANREFVFIIVRNSLLRPQDCVNP